MAARCPLRHIVFRRRRNRTLGASALCVRSAHRRPGRCLKHPLLVLLALGAVVPILGLFINIRAHSFTYTLTLWAVVALDQVRDGKYRYLCVFPPMMALWVNLHGGFLMGLGIIGSSMGFFLLGLDGLCARPTGRQIGAIIVAGLATLAATLLNPWGFGLYGYLAQELGANHSIITEWQPIQGAQLLFYFGFLIVPLVLWVLSSIFAADPESKLRGGFLRQLSLVLMLLITAYSTWKHARFFVIMALFGTVLASDCAGYLLRRVQQQQPMELVEKILQPRWTAVVATVGTILFGLQFTATLVTQPRIAVNPVNYPIEAARWLGDNPVGTNVALPLHWGSYILWHRPELRVAADGRNPTIYHDEWIDRYLRA